jgi:hypothetical protein
VESHEEVLHEKDKESEMLKHELSEQQMMILELNMKGIYAFCVCVY